MDAWTHTGLALVVDERSVKQQLSSRQKAGIHCVLLNYFAQYMREWSLDEVQGCTTIVRAHGSA